MDDAVSMRPRQQHGERRRRRSCSRSQLSMPIGHQAGFLLCLLSVLHRESLLHLLRSVALEAIAGLVSLEQQPQATGSPYLAVPLLVLGTKLSAQHG